MDKKPIMTLDDYEDEVIKKVAMMTDEEKEEYFKKTEKSREIAKKHNIKTVNAHDLGDDEIYYATGDNLGAILDLITETFTLKTRTKDGRTSRHRSKIFITAHPDDFKELFDEISVMFLKESNCDIYYYDEFNENAYKKTYSQLLSQMVLLVVLVTNKFLTEDSRALNLDLAIAKKYNIPILPIYIDGSIQTFNETIGNIELLDYRGDDFSGKLKNYLEKNTINENMFIEIEQEFSQNIFLSYRKKDAKEAIKVLKFFKNNNKLWDTSVWYDDYLTPGEEYNNEIDEQIKKCDLFLLLVTPNLLEPGNYVMSIEYPKALQYGKEILAIEVAATSNELSKAFKGLPEKVTFGDARFLQRLNKLARDALLPNKSTSKHLYLMGLAYFYGIGVSRDTKYAFSLLRNAAKQKHLLAICFLAEVKDYDTMNEDDELFLLYEYALQEIEKEFANKYFANIKAWWKLGDVLTAHYVTIRDFDKEIELLLKMEQYAPYVSIRKADVLTKKARVYFRLAASSEMTNDYRSMTAYTEKANKHINEVIESDVANKPLALRFSIAFYELKVAVLKNDYNAFNEVFKKMGFLYKTFLKEVDIRIQNVDFEYAQFLLSYSLLLFSFKDKAIKELAYEKALVAIELLLSVEQKSFTHPLVATVYGTVSANYFHDRDFNKAIKYGKLAVEHSKKSLVRKSPSYLEVLAKSLFSYANINFQSDYDDEAEVHFLELIDFCNHNTFPNSVYYLKMASDYYAQLLVTQGRYEEAIASYTDFVVKVVREELSGDEVYSYCADFCYRSGFIALQYLEDEKRGRSMLEYTLSFINNIENPSEEILNLKHALMKMST